MALEKHRGNGGGHQRSPAASRHQQCNVRRKRRRKSSNLYHLAAIGRKMSGWVRGGGIKVNRSKTASMAAA